MPSFASDPFVYLRQRAIRGGGSGEAVIPPPSDQTLLRREIDGTVTVLSLATPYTPSLARQPDGTVTVSG